MSVSDLDESDQLDEHGPPRGPPYDVFLSYNSDDRGVVRNVARRLREAGVTVWFDKEALPPGASWMRELEARLGDSRACAVFHGPNDIVGWERQEMEVALSRGIADHDFRVFAVLLPGLGYFDASMLPPFLATRQWVDLRDGPESEAAIQDFVNAIYGVARVPEPPPDDEGECPYRGLDMFEEEHAKYFFGRRAQVQRLVEVLRRDRFVAVVGQSGVGKSSLVRAGLLPQLGAGALPGSELWRVLLLRPGPLPATTLAAKLLALRPDGSMQREVDRFLTDDRTLYRAATLAVDDKLQGNKLLVVVDQFEEIFTLCHHSAERSAFLANLHYAATFPHGHAVVVVAMRGDFYPRLAQFPGFAQLFQSHHMLVGRMDDSQLREIILEPAYKAGLSVEQGLADTILRDVEREPGNLPLLEHALLGTWQNRRGRQLTLAGYRATGGVERGLGERAEAVYESLSDAARVQTRNVFLRLIQPGEGTEDTRRRVPMSEVTTSGSEAVREVVRRFADARLLTSSADDVTGEPRLEISHEAVITGWQRCLRWVDEDRTGLLVHRRLTVAAQEWKRHGRNKDSLYHGVPLAEAEEWQNRAPGRLNWLEQDFLAASRALERATRRASRRRVVLGFVAMSIALLMIVAFAVYRNDQARLARSGQLAAEADRNLNVDPALSLVLALRARDVASSPQADEALRQATVESRGRALITTTGGAVRSLRLLPGRSEAVGGSDNGTVSLWDVATSSLKQPLPSHQGKTYAVGVSPDGRYVASGGQDRIVLLTDLGNGQSRMLLTPPASVANLEFSHNGKLLAVALFDGTVHVVDAMTGREQQVIAVGSGFVYAVAFSADDASLATANGGRAKVWRVADRALLRDWDVGGPTDWVATSPSRPEVAAVSRDGKVRIWDTNTGALLQELSVSTDDLYVVRFSPDGERFAAAGLGGSVYLWDRSGIRLATLRGHSGTVYDLEFDRQGDTLVSAGGDGTVRTWDVRVPPYVRSPVTTAVFDRSGTRIISGGADGHLRVWRRGDLSAAVIDIPDHGVLSQALFSSDGSKILSYATDGIVNVRDAADGKLLGSFNAGVGRIRTVASDPSDQRLVVGGDDGFRVIDYTGAEIEPLRRGDSPVGAARFSPNGDSVLVGRDDGSVALWGPARNPVTIKPVDYRTINEAEFNSDGSRIVTADASGSVTIWDVHGTRITGMRGHEGSATGVRFSRDDRQAISSGVDGTVRVWDVATSSTLAVIDNGDGATSYVDVSADGTIVTSARNRKVLRVLKCEACGPQEYVVGLAQSRAFRKLTADEEARFSTSS